MDGCTWRQDLLQVGLGWTRLDLFDSVHLSRNHKDPEGICFVEMSEPLCLGQAMELFLPCSHGSLDGRWHAKVCVCYLDIVDSRRASRV